MPPYLELAENGLSERKTHVKGYWRERHHTAAHTRHLSEPVFSYIKVPDPENKLAPKYFREDTFDTFPDDEFAKLIMYVTPFNTQQHLQAIIKRRNARRSGLKEDALLSGNIFKSIGNFVGGAFKTIAKVGIGAVKSFIGIDSGSGGSSQPVVVNVPPAPQQQQAAPGIFDTILKGKILGLPTPLVIVGGIIAAKKLKLF